MDLREWIARRRPPVPAEFLPHLHLHLPGGAGKGGEEGEALLEAGIRALQEVLARPGRRREVAFRLLAADAFLTYACEVAADAPDVEEALLRVLRRTVSLTPP